MGSDAPRTDNGEAATALRAAALSYIQDPDSDEHAAQAITRAVLVSAVGLALTGAIELAIALVTGSVALLGDALHNLSDVSTSFVVFLGFWVSKIGQTFTLERAADAHAAIERRATVGKTLLVVGAAHPNPLQTAIS
jgi:Co/Zn/Cd efflux system component